MASGALPANRFDVFNDTSFTSTVDSDQSSLDLIDFGDNSFAPLGSISIANAQNRKSTGRIVESLVNDLEKFHLGDSQQIDQFNDKPIPSLKTTVQPIDDTPRPPTAHTVLRVLETVQEDDSLIAAASAADSVLDRSQRYIEVPVDQYTQHPLAIAVRSLPPIEEQLAKHRRGEFEWVMTIRVPKATSIDASSVQTDQSTGHDSDRLYFGCNLLPSRARQEDSAVGSYTLLVTPLEGDAELDAETELTRDEKMMALSENVIEHVTPYKTLHTQPEVKVKEVSPGSIHSGGDDDSVEIITSRSPAQHVSRIEDSVEALDQLEEQLEAFDVAANMRGLSRDVSKPSVKSPDQPLFANMERSKAPRPIKTSPRTSAPRVHFKPSGLRHSSSTRRSASMVLLDPPKLLDSPKLKVEDKALLQARPKKSPVKELTSLLPPKQLARSTKPTTVPTFQLPGEAVARRLKEQREARLSVAANTKPPQAAAPLALRRAKSTKPPTRSTFELPGEAISRRKREEREARLKAEEEAERKRREFKAKPIRVGGVPSSVPRGTVTSRARESNVVVSENSPRAAPMGNKRVSMLMAREPLSSSSNQTQPRGRHLTTESSQVSRATSSSTGSISGKRSAVSTEDVQAQRVRGREIMQRDSMFGIDRQREKHEREALARLAREQAAERSRQQSREWAEKQRRKRATVGSLRDVVASSS